MRYIIEGQVSFANTVIFCSCGQGCSRRYYGHEEILNRQGFGGACPAFLYLNWKSKAGIFGIKVGITWNTEIPNRVAVVSETSVKQNKYLLPESRRSALQQDCSSSHVAENKNSRSPGFIESDLCPGGAMGNKGCMNVRFPARFKIFLLGQVRLSHTYWCFP